jgi:hypothetical protein
LHPSGTPGREILFSAEVCALDASWVGRGPVAEATSMQAGSPQAAANANQGARRRKAGSSIFEADMHRS